MMCLCPVLIIYCTAQCPVFIMGCTEQCPVLIIYYTKQCPLYSCTVLNNVLCTHVLYLSILYTDVLTLQLLSSSAENTMHPHFFPGIPLRDKGSREWKTERGKQWSGELRCVHHKCNHCIKSFFTKTA